MNTFLVAFRRAKYYGILNYEAVNYQLEQGNKTLTIGGQIEWLKAFNLTVK